MRYVLARIEQENQNEAYRIFISESLRLAPENKHLKMNYLEFLDYLKNPKKEEKVEIIIKDVMKNAGLKFEGGDTDEYI